MSQSLPFGTCEPIIIEEPILHTDSDTAFIIEFEKKVQYILDTYQLLEKNQNIVVAASGGKDSTTILYLLKKFGYSITALSVDVHIGCYTEKNRENLLTFCTSYNIPCKIVDYNEEFGMGVCYLRDALKEKGFDLNSCTICGVPRRYLINKYTRKMGADILVTGHNLDDESQVVLMNLLRNTLYLGARGGPRTGLLKDDRFVPRVKPLYFVTNDEVSRYSKLHRFPVAYKDCPCGLDAYRQTIKEWLNSAEKKSPGTKMNLITWYLTHLPTLQAHYANQMSALQACSSCDEPATGTMCKTCELMHKLL